MVEVALTPMLKLDGTQLHLDDLALVSLTVDRSIHRAGRTVLRFVDADHERFDDGRFVLGAGIEVLIPDGGNSLKTVFDGKITTVGVDHDLDKPLPELVVHAQEPGHRLAASSSFTTYLKQTPGDVVSAIAEKHGLTPQVDTPGRVRPYLLQSGTDHALLSYLAASLGCEWFIRGKTLHFRERSDRDGGPTLKPSDGSLIRFSASYSGSATPNDIEVLGWDPTQQAPVVSKAGAVVSSPTSAELGSDASFVEEQYGKAQGEFGSALRVATSAVRDDAEAQTLAEAIGRELVGAGLRIEGVAAGNPAIDAGGTVRIQELGEKLPGTYYVTDVVHEFGDDQVLTRFWSSGVRNQEPVTGSSWPGSLDGWGQHGLLLGKVSNNNDPEKLGRVKVYLTSLGDDVESDWARLVFAGAGKSRGMDFRPELGDEVVVGFDRGDPRFPFVLGGVWSKVNKPPGDGVVEQGVVSQRRITSRTGHTITLADGKTDRAPTRERYVEIALADGTTKARFAEDGIEIESASGMPLVLKSGGTSVTITDDGGLVVKAKSLKLDIEGSVEIAGADVSVEARAGVKVDGGSSFEAKAAKAKLEAIGGAEIKGAMVKIN